MAARSYSHSYLAAQVAGSVRMEGIHVSREDETMMTNIIAGKASGAELSNQLVERYRQQNKATLKLATS